MDIDIFVTSLSKTFFIFPSTCCFYMENWMLLMYIVWSRYALHCRMEKLHNYVSYVKNVRQPLNIIYDIIVEHSIDLVMSFDRIYCIFSHHRSGRNRFTLNWRYNFNGFSLTAEQNNNKCSCFNSWFQSSLFIVIFFSCGMNKRDK